MLQYLSNISILQFVIENVLSVTYFHKLIWIGHMFAISKDSQAGMFATVAG